jgi:hypothetical protein
VFIALPAALTVLVPVAALSLPGPANSWAAGLPGCDPSRPAVAHNAGQHTLSPQPANAPVPCGMLTGWPAVENRVEVTNGGTVVYEPALLGGPVLAGDGHVPGWGKQFGIARTFNQGAKWNATSVHVAPEAYAFDGQVDNNLYVDHNTGRLFWYMYNSGIGAPQIPYACGTGRGAGVAFSDDNGATFRSGYDFDHDCSENPTNVTGKPRVPGEHLGYPDIVYLCGDNASTGIATTGTLGFSCSKSLNGGVSWLGTTRGPQGFYSGIAKDRFHPYPQCAGKSSSAGAGVQPLPDGTLLVVVTCNGNTFLSQSTDEGGTWKIAYKIPHGGSFRADSVGNLYLLEKLTVGSADQLLLSHSTDRGKTWSPELNIVAPGVTSVGTMMFAQGTFTRGLVGDVAVTYYGIRKGKTTSDGFITATKDALAANPVFWSGQVNSPKRPLLFNTKTSGNIGITVLDFNGGAWAPDGRSVWGSWVQDCGANAATDPNCTKRYPKINPGNPDDGFAGRLVWPPA